MSISDKEVCVALGNDLYDEVCQATLSGNYGIVASGHGVVSSSGFGDGGYALLIAKEGEVVVGAEVVFINKQTCPNCGSTFEPREADITYCDDCYAEEYSEYCSECGNLTPDDELRDGMCEDCYEEWHGKHVCRNCGGASEEELDDGLCSSCHDDLGN
jgi:hypothetical protein